jgi:hypothetical protein
VKHRNGLLFPLMVLAAGSVTAFGCIGIAAITGYMPLARSGMTPLGDYPMAPAVSLEQAMPARGQTTDPMAVVAIDSGNGPAKAIQFEPGKAVGVVRKPALN